MSSFTLAGGREAMAHFCILDTTIRQSKPYNVNKSATNWLRGLCNGMEMAGSTVNDQQTFTVAGHVDTERKHCQEYQPIDRHHCPTPTVVFGPKLSEVCKSLESYFCPLQTDRKFSVVFNIEGCRYGRQERK